MCFRSGEMKVGLIYQPCGLGDILFMQKLGYHMQDQGYKVYWLDSRIQMANDYIDDFEFVSWEDEGNPTSTIPDAPQFPFKEEYIQGVPSKITDELYFLQGEGYTELMNGKYERAEWTGKITETILSSTETKKKKMNFFIMSWV